MNHYHADVLTNELEGVLRFSTNIAAVVVPGTRFTVTSNSNFLVGDWVEITTGAGAQRTQITDIQPGVFTISPAIAGLAHGQFVRFTLPHVIYNYKAIEAAQAKLLVRPFLAVTLPKQDKIARIPKGSSPEVGVMDSTRVTLYLETPFTVQLNGQTEGGFDTYHHPAIRHLRKFLWGHKALDIPAALQLCWRSGTVGMHPADVPESAWRTPEGERHIFFVVLWDFTTIPGG